jgi:hypothetical protein
VQCDLTGAARIQYHKLHGQEQEKRRQKTIVYAFRLSSSVLAVQCIMKISKGGANLKSLNRPDKPASNCSSSLDALVLATYFSVNQD